MAHEYIPPSEIDGSPAEVERAAINQIAELYEEAVAQGRNAFMTRVLDSEPSISPETLAIRWTESDRCAEFARIRVLLNRL